MIDALQSGDDSACYCALSELCSALALVGRFAARAAQLIAPHAFVSQSVEENLSGVDIATLCDALVGVLSTSQVCVCVCVCVCV